MVIKDVMKVAGLTCSGVAVESARGRDGGISPPTDDVATVVERNTPGCVGRTMELLWESVVLGGDRGGGFEQDLQAIGATDPSEELANSSGRHERSTFRCPRRGAASSPSTSTASRC